MSTTTRVPRPAQDRANSSALMGALQADPVLLQRRIAASFQAVRSLDGVDPTRIGAIGFCFGDRCALLAAPMGLPMRPW